MKDKYDTQIEVKHDKYVRNTDIDLLSKINWDNHVNDPIIISLI